MLKELNIAPSARFSENSSSCTNSCFMLKPNHQHYPARVKSTTCIVPDWNIQRIQGTNRWWASSKQLNSAVLNGTWIRRPVFMSLRSLAGLRDQLEWNSESRTLHRMVTLPATAKELTLRPNCWILNCATPEPWIDGPVRNSSKSGQHVRNSGFPYTLMEIRHPSWEN